jgi:hypothetical protein
LHPEYFSKRFLPSLPSRNIHFKFDPRVLGHPVYSWKAKKKSLLTDELAIVYKIHIERKNKANLAKQEDKERLQIDPTLDLQCSSNTIWGRISSVASNVRGGHNVPDNELE